MAASEGRHHATLPVAGTYSPGWDVAFPSPRPILKDAPDPWPRRRLGLFVSTWEAADGGCITYSQLNHHCTE